MFRKEWCIRPGPAGTLESHHVGVTDRGPACEWDELLFGGAAEHYEQGRLPYPEGLTDALVVAGSLGPCARLLDVGCGPGTIALPMAAHVGEVVGVDPDGGMVAEAARLAREREIRGVRFVRLRAEELPAGLGRFDMATFAASFHWMDRPRVARIVRAMLRPGGTAVTIGGGWNRALPAPGARFPAPPWMGITDLVRTYLGGDRRAGRSLRAADPVDMDTAWIGAGFDGPEVVSVADDRTYERTVDDVIAGTLSRSVSAPHLFGERLGAFRSDLRRLLLEVSPEGRFSLRMADTTVRVWRPAAGV